MFKVVMIHNDDHPIPGWVDQKLKAAGIEWAYHQCENRADMERWASDADIIWTHGTKYGLVVEENMDVFRKLGAVIKPGSGTDHIDHEACTRRGIIVAHSPEVPTDPTSDQHIALLFSAVRQVTRQDRLVRHGQWDPQLAMPVGQLTGADLGIVGFGRIGKAVARKLIGFQMNTRVYDPFVDADTIIALGCRKEDLGTLLRESQYVIIACPLTDDTRGMIGEKQLHMMRSDAVLVNAARAGIVDEVDLLAALRAGWIAGAALDVLGRHPLKPGDEWLALENVIFTPHMGGSRHDYPDGIYVDVVEDIIRVSKGLMPRWIANQDVVPKWNLRGEEETEPDPKWVSVSR
ncbi:MAG: D-glycerate dehydrogenase [Armatimonadetes bacterium]|nr:D-glycerate dehydrogenase [Armatimonadota bacterium]